MREDDCLTFAREKGETASNLSEPLIVEACNRVVENNGCVRTPETRFRQEVREGDYLLFAFRERVAQLVFGSEKFPTSSLSSVVTERAKMRRCPGWGVR